VNQLYYGDNLDILRKHIADESVDLVYLDPPFNSNRSYNVIFREANGTAADSQITFFDGTRTGTRPPSTCGWSLLGLSESKQRVW